VPLVRIDVGTGWSAAELDALGAAVHAALVETLAVPDRDRFQVISEHQAGRFVFDRSYLGIDRSDRFVLVHVTLSRGRTTEAKQAFYRALAERLAEALDLRPEDLAVCLVENDREDWSFGRGEASYLVLPREEWR
jgi:4-oxalocrotonate tautomerase